MILVWLLTGCILVVKCLNIFVPPFPHLNNGDTRRVHCTKVPPGLCEALRVTPGVYKGLCVHLSAVVVSGY